MKCVAVQYAPDGGWQTDQQGGDYRQMLVIWEVLAFLWSEKCIEFKDKEELGKAVSKLGFSLAEG